MKVPQEGLGLVGMSCRAGRAHLKPKHIQGRGSGDSQHLKVFPELSFLVWQAGEGQGGSAGVKELLWMLQNLLSTPQGWAAAGSPCRCCWNTGRARPAQDKVILLQITK